MSEPFESSSVLDEPAVAVMSAFVPLLILGLTILVWFGFQATQLRVEGEAMRNAIVGQDKPMQDSKKVRDALDAVARGTAQLANAGNPNAKLVIDELKKRGITIDPNKPTGSAPATTATP